MHAADNRKGTELLQLGPCRRAQTSQRSTMAARVNQQHVLESCEILGFRGADQLGGAGSGGGGHLFWRLLKILIQLSCCGDGGADRTGAPNRTNGA